MRNQSALEQEVRALIIQEGPLSIADYMTLCLTHPKHGYYTNGHPVGGPGSAISQGGDFITSPEVSQMFGELIAVWCMEIWERLGCPTHFNLVEIGPGRGTMMNDLIRASSAHADFLAAAQFSLIEISPTLRHQQQGLLKEKNVSIQWLNNISDLPKTPSIIIGNELLDALPVHQWIKIEDHWLERAVGLRDDKLHFTTRFAQLDSAHLPKNHTRLPDGTVFETAPAREGYIAHIAESLNNNFGACLMIDYGHLQSGFGDTFQAVQDHAYASPIASPGNADLTSHVDFQPLLAAALAQNCSAPAPTTQAKFLLALGLLERAGALGNGKKSELQQNLREAVDRLAGPDQMGELFKVMAFGHFPKQISIWPGFT